MDDFGYTTICLLTLLELTALSIRVFQFLDLKYVNAI